MYKEKRRGETNLWFNFVNIENTEFGKCVIHDTEYTKYRL